MKTKTLKVQYFRKIVEIYSTDGWTDPNLNLYFIRIVQRATYIQWLSSHYLPPLGHSSATAFSVIQNKDGEHSNKIYNVSEVGFWNFNETKNEQNFKWKFIKTKWFWNFDLGDLDNGL